MDSGMNHSAAKIDWPRVLTEGLISGTLMGGLFGLVVIKGASENVRILDVLLVAGAILMRWSLFARQLDRIESKLSN